MTTAAYDAGDERPDAEPGGGRDDRGHAEGDDRRRLRDEPPKEREPPLKQRFRHDRGLSDEDPGRQRRRNEPDLAAVEEEADQRRRREGGEREGDSGRQRREDGGRGSLLDPIRTLDEGGEHPALGEEGADHDQRARTRTAPSPSA